MPVNIANRLYPPPNVLGLPFPIPDFHIMVYLTAPGDEMLFLDGSVMSYAEN